MKTTINVLITELAGNHPDGFLSNKFGDALQAVLIDAVSADYPDSEVSVEVDTQMRTCGATPAPIISVVGFDDYEVTRRVELIVDTEMQIFGESCMQDEAYFE